MAVDTSKTICGGIPTFFFSGILQETAICIMETPRFPAFFVFEA